MPKKSTTASSASKPKRSAKPLSANHRPTEQAIALRAYEIFLRRGATNGHALEDWLQAEKELAAASEEETFAQAVGAG